MKKKILMCDDDEGIVTMLKIFLATRRYITFRNKTVSISTLPSKIKILTW